MTSYPKGGRRGRIGSAYLVAGCVFMVAGEVTATPVTATPVTATPVTATPVTATPVTAAPGAAPHAAPRTETQLQAEVLFRHAQEELEAGRVGEACRAFAASQALDAAVGTQYNLARCLERLGNNADAYRNYVEVVNVTQAVGQMERATAARRRAEATWAKVGRVRLQLAPELSAQLPEVAIDGRVIAEHELHAPVPVDPGKHLVKVSAPRCEPFETPLEVASAGEDVTLQLAALVPVPLSRRVGSGLVEGQLDATPVAEMGPTAPAVASASSPSTPAGDPGAELPWQPSRPPHGHASGRGFFASPWNVAGLGLGGLAVGGLVTSVVYGLGAADDKELAKPYCDGGQCLPEGAEAYRRAQSQAATATTALIVAGAAAPLAAFAFWRGAQAKPAIVITSNGVLLRSQW